MKKFLIAVLGPVLAFLIVGYAMMSLTGRDRFASTGEAASVPLNYRAGGYDAEAARAYWNWLGADGRQAELRFLKADLVFPLWYGGTMLASLLYAWAALGRRFSRIWLILPPAGAVLADWVENSVHLQQLGNYMHGQLMFNELIDAASVATTVKAASFWLAALMIVALAARAFLIKPGEGS